MDDPLDEEDHDAATIAALHLLLGDKSPKQVTEALRKAFREEYSILTKQNLNYLKDRRADCRAVIKEIKANLDGQSPLGKIAQENMLQRFVDVERYFAMIEGIIIRAE